MYKEKLIEFIDNYPGVIFYIQVDNNLKEIEFFKENEKYFFSTYDCDSNKVVDEDSQIKESVDVLDEDTCEIFVNRWRNMTLKDYMEIKK